ncbi:hypothetical protein Pint_35852 [Pistacia integerrima]|uniref:Uncharacterized protein n=1 Tax=Pistacia integerrima TaxID=434235 RepID=A0ACC0Y208_9ROSI|nr:hypothetical protein Pint_35852 [Pistacia integerrima]
MLGCDSYSGLSVEGLKLILPLNAILDAGLHDQNCSASKEIAGKGGSFTPNGFPPSGSWGRPVHFLVKLQLKYQLHVKSIALTLALKTVQSAV